MVFAQAKPTKPAVTRPQRRPLPPRPPIRARRAIKVKGLISLSKDGSSYLITKDRGILEIVAESPTVKMVIEGISSVTNRDGAQPTLWGVATGRLDTTTGASGTRPAVYAKDLDVYDSEK